ncbi:C-C chemokine receptor type 4 [Pelobates cultripes]|uniref:C-C chemokine receptor type 4 n=1 Tax=Pelobates cultripes TaxID=61616 RepID=A0AAD1RTT0_PELCU|nr:C-C chemokine receptor type 4 [Pelobates cultripes]
MTSSATMNVTADAIFTTGEYEYPENYLTDLEIISPYTSIFKPIVYCLTFVFGLIGNILVMIVLVGCKKLSTMTDIYLLNMAISDMVFVLSLPFLAYTATDQWVFGDFMCKLLSALYFTGFYSGIFFIMIISVDRYMAVVHVVFSLKVRTVHWGLIISIIIWLISFFFSIPSFITHQVYHSNYYFCVPIYPSDSIMNWKLFSYININIFGLIIPLCTLTYCYSQIIMNLRRNKTKQKKYAIRLILTVVIVFYLFWGPYNILLFLHILEMFGVLKDRDVSHLNLALEITQILTLVHCCLNPIIYTFAGEKFKKYLYIILRKPFRAIKTSRIRQSFQSSFTDRTSTSKESRTCSVTDEFV